LVAYTNAVPEQGGTTPAIDDDTGLLFYLPSAGRKKVSAAFDAAFDGGRITSDGGVSLLALADRRLGIVDRIAGLIADPINRCKGGQFVAHIKALPDLPYDGHTLARVLPEL
jgi:hypothetical protein